MRLILAAALFLVGCSHKTYESARHENYDFAKLKTVAVIHPDIDDAATRNAQKLFDKAFAQTLEQKGYSVVGDRSKADFLLTYHLGVTDTRHLSNDYRVIGIAPTYFSPHYGHYGYHYMVAPSTQSTTAREGKIIVEAIDPKADNLVFWNAKMTDRLKAFKSPEERAAFIKKVAQKVLSTFPDRK
ncbi:MAG: DUF4136 domain-containing protein [Epsilonproteobacteria bacterium]|nr:DUF4136 domain-containing protein [Campylobacterota bacterium]